LQEFVTEKRLYPVVRTVYKRMSFQWPNDNSLRMSIDLELAMIREKVDHLTWFTPEERLEAEDIDDFPFVIFEVKLAPKYSENPPEWIQAIMNSGLLITIPRFSKALHGMYHFYSNACQQSSKPLSVPEWSDKFFELTGEPIAESPLVYTQRSDPTNTIGNLYKVAPIMERSNVSAKTLTSYLGNVFKSPHKRSAPSVPSPNVRVEPKTFFANERTYLTWFQSSLMMATFGVALQNIGDSGSSNFGNGLLIVSVGLLGYASWTYSSRNYALERRLAFGYQDKYGPLVLASVLVVGFIAQIISNLAGNTNV